VIWGLQLLILENNALIINGTTVHVITANGPEEIDYTHYGIDNAL
jgi:glyceraldehyde 3-phosphate dehydrogenase